MKDILKSKNKAWKVEKELIVFKLSWKLCNSQIWAKSKQTPSITQSNSKMIKQKSSNLFVFAKLWHTEKTIFNQNSRMPKLK